MITYRHHIVSLVAVFLALAVGVALGGGPLSELGRGTDDPAAAAGQDADTRRALALGDDHAAKTAEAVYGGRLRGHPVALLTVPGVDEEQVAALTGQVEAAGGTVAGRYDLREGLLSPGEKSLVDTLGSQLMTRVDDGVVDLEAPTYVRMGQLLGLAVASTDPDGEPVGDGAAVRESLAAAELLTAATEDAPRAPLVLLVLGEGTDPDVLSGLVSGLATSTVGLVVAGDAESGRTGDVAALRTEAVADDVTTVDGTGSTVGQVTAVLALLRELAGTGGSFGASGAEGAVPLG